MSSFKSYDIYFKYYTLGGLDWELFYRTVSCDIDESLKYLDKKVAEKEVYTILKNYNLEGVRFQWKSQEEIKFEKDTGNLFSLATVYPVLDVGGDEEEGYRVEETYLLSLNPIVFPLKLFDMVIKHEIAHLKTSLCDYDLDFISYCQENNIVSSIILV